MRSAGIPILPMLTNNYGAKFRSEPIVRIMNNQEKRMALIKQLADQCEQYGFTGINLDLEDLNITDNVPLITLVKDFSTVFHARGLYVTQAIAAFNDDYDMQELAKYDDYLFLMAYDEHNSTSQPGAISSQRWVEKATDWAAKNVPNDKIVLGLAAYGYDWTEGKPVGSTVSFDQIIATAQNAEAKIAFNDDTYNLNFSYEDNTNGTLHHVFFPDAATTFNIMRFGSEYHLAGFGLWRLGTEDKRIWRFYGKDMGWENAAKLSIAKLMQLNGTDDVNFVGSGEVLNVTSEPHHGKIAVTMDKDNCLITEEYYRELPTTYTVQRLGKCKPKQLVITFDDSPEKLAFSETSVRCRAHHRQPYVYPPRYVRKLRPPFVCRTKANAYAYRERYRAKHHSFSRTIQRRCRSNRTRRNMANDNCKSQKLSFRGRINRP